MPVLRFAEDFMELWEPSSAVRNSWLHLETAAQELMTLMEASEREFKSFRDLRMMEEDLAKSGPGPEGLVEFLQVLFAKVVLRMQLKTNDALEVFFQSANTANPLGLALAGRAVLEHVSLLQFLVAEVPWRNQRAIRSEVLATFLKTLHRMALGSTFDWEQLTSPQGFRRLLQSGKWKRASKEHLPAMWDLVKRVDNDLLRLRRTTEPGQILFYYSILCDIVHPSWGGDVAYPRAAQRAAMSFDSERDHRKGAAVLLGLCVVELVDHLIRLSRQAKDARPMRIDDL